MHAAVLLGFFTSPGWSSLYRWINDDCEVASGRWR